MYYYFADSRFNDGLLSAYNNTQPSLQLPPQSRGPITGRPGRLSGWLWTQYYTSVYVISCGLVSPLIANVLLWGHLLCIVLYINHPHRPSTIPTWSNTVANTYNGKVGEVSRMPRHHRTHFFLHLYLDRPPTRDQAGWFWGEGCTSIKMGSC